MLVGEHVHPEPHALQRNSHGRHHELRHGPNLLLELHGQPVLLQRDNVPIYQWANVLYLPSSFVHRQWRLQLVSVLAVPGFLPERPVQLQWGV